MKKKTIVLSIILLILIFSTNILANDSNGGLIISPFPGINYPFQVENITTAIGLLGLVVPSYNGFALSFLFNNAKDYSEGLGIALLFQSYMNGFFGSTITLGFNYFNNSFKGLQFTFVANLNFGEFDGIQAGMLNYNSTKSKGLQIGFLNLNMNEFDGFSFGLASITKNFTGKISINIFGNLNFNDFNGFQAGMLNLNIGDFNGIQIGLLNLNLRSSRNYSGRILLSPVHFNGIQIGIVNINSYFEGFQIGLINIAKVSNGFSIGLFNFFKNGYNRIETTYNELDILKLTLKWGDRKLYTVIGYGMDSTQTIFQSSFGFGTHFDFGFLGLDIELFFQGRSDIENMEYYLSNPYSIYGNSYSEYYDGYQYYYYPEVSIPRLVGYLILGDSSSISLRFNLVLSLGFIEIIGGVTYNLGFRLDPASGSFSWYIPSDINPIIDDVNNFTFFKYGWFGFTLGIQIRL